MNDERLERGIDHFNRGYFFEAHDILEDLWKETVGNNKLFLQGLIQVSVGFYHIFNKNYKGAVSQFTKGLTKLEGYKPSHEGVELQRFTAKVDEWRRMAERGFLGEAVIAEESRVPKILTITSQLK
jgi:predicted metal-dependent hydrolase